jgi:hypothetical protein
VDRDAGGLEACQTRPAGGPAAMTDGARTTPGFRRPLPPLSLPLGSGQVAHGCLVDADRGLQAVTERRVDDADVMHDQ